MQWKSVVALSALAIIFCLSFNFSETAADDNTGEMLADNNAGKLGIGFHSRFPVNGISVKYWTPTEIGLQGIFMRYGISLPTEDMSGALTTLSGRFLYTIKKESNVRFYFGAGASYTNGKVKEDGDEDTGSGFGLEGVGGVEYSLSGLPNLGLAFEFGGAFMRLSSEDSDDKLDLLFTTSGSVGIHYYF